MTVRITGRYLGGLGVEATHDPSGTTLRTAAPVDNNGDGSSFSPTDLVATGLGTCMLTLMGIAAERLDIDLDGLRFELEKHMASDPRRIDRIPVKVHMPPGLTPEQRVKLERAALTCPVHRTLPGTVENPVQFVYPD